MLYGLKHFEVLDSSSVGSSSYFLNRIRNSPDLHQQSSLNASVITLQIRLFNLSYTLLLHHNPGSIIAPDFQAFSVLANGRIEAFSFFINRHKCKLLLMHFSRKEYYAN